MLYHRIPQSILNIDITLRRQMTRTNKVVYWNQKSHSITSKTETNTKQRENWWNRKKCKQTHAQAHQLQINTNATKKWNCAKVKKWIFVLLLLSSSLCVRARKCALFRDTDSTERHRAKISRRQQPTAKHCKSGFSMKQQRAEYTDWICVLL